MAFPINNGRPARGFTLIELLVVMSIIGALMALVPGIAMTNAMRDIMAGDMVAGISKAAEALLIGAAIALGTALALGLTRMVTGGAL